LARRPAYTLPKPPQPMTFRALQPPVASSSSSKLKCRQPGNRARCSGGASPARPSCAACCARRSQKRPKRPAALHAAATAPARTSRARASVGHAGGCGFGDSAAAPGAEGQAADWHRGHARVWPRPRPSGRAHRRELRISLRARPWRPYKVHWYVHQRPTQALKSATNLGRTLDTLSCLGAAACCVRHVQCSGGKDQDALCQVSERNQRAEPWFAGGGVCTTLPHATDHQHSFCFVRACRNSLPGTL